MLPWLADDAQVDAMCARLGVQSATWRRHLENPGWAANNANAQVLLTGLALAAWDQLKTAVPPPVAIAGYSVGELAAFSVAGVFDSNTAHVLAGVRAAAMDRCAAQRHGGLMVMTGLGQAAVDQICAQTGLALAIRNGPLSVVVGGLVANLARGQTAATEAGAQCTRLRVAVASHTPWMQEAADGFARHLATLACQAPHTVLFSNAGDRIQSAAAAQKALAAQIAQTVRWDECMDNIAARNVTCVLEIGPGQALTKLWNQQYPGIPGRACDDFRSASAIIRWLRSHARV